MAHGIALAALCVPVRAQAQQDCQFVAPTRRAVGRGPLTFVSLPHLVCADGVEIFADSAVANSQLGMQHLMGSVRYRDQTRELRADTARYFTDQGRLQANGSVLVRDATDGSQVENGRLVYLRQTDFRDVETMTVTIDADGVRPRARIPPPVREDAEPGSDPPPPYVVEGDRIYLRGDSYFAASGAVAIERDSLFAWADSAEYDQEEADALLLDGAARVVSGTNELVGRTITMETPGSDTSRVHAVREAVLTGDGILLTSPQIVVFLADGELDRLIATPMRFEDRTAADSVDLVRPVANLDDAVLTADSLDIVAAQATVERVVAVGRARSVSTARDSLNTPDLPEVARTDWLEGDTVIVTFRPEQAEAPEEGAPATPAGEQRYEIETVVAAGAARALYRLAPSDSTATVGVDPPALHYVVGSRITIEWLDGEVDGMQVVGQTQGVHLEPLAPRVVADTASADSALALPDTGAARVDTLATHVGNAAGSGRAPPGRPTPERRDSPEEEPWIREGGTSGAGCGPSLSRRSTGAVEW